MIQWEVEMTVLQQQLDKDEEWEKGKQNSTGELMLDIAYAVGGCGSIGKFDLLDALSFAHAWKTSLEFPIDLLIGEGPYEVSTRALSSIENAEVSF
jgi:hypothetical protein